MAARSWEDPLLALAHEALSSPAQRHRIQTDQHALEKAYRHCATMTKHNSRTFYMASSLLPKPKRRAAHALYALCRTTDDLIDKGDKAKDLRAALESWRASVAATPHPHDPVALAWADAQAQFDIPHGYAQQLFDGIARDLTQQRYQTFDELTEYCYGVASTVGLMVMHIVNFRGAAAVPYAVKLGIALQLTNILRDVGEDYRAGRIYLPLEELAAFGVTEAEIVAGQVTDHWRAFMRFQIERTRMLYAEAEPGIALLDPDGRFAIAAASTLYSAILDDIEAHDYDVFSRRAHLGAWGKLKRLPATWWRSKRVGQ
jgi:phytoene synthase